MSEEQLEQQPEVETTFKDTLDQYSNLVLGYVLQSLKARNFTFYGVSLVSLVGLFLALEVGDIFNKIPFYGSLSTTAFTGWLIYSMVTVERRKVLFAKLDEIKAAVLGTEEQT
jgi:hypothetical protein